MNAILRAIRRGVQSGCAGLCVAAGAAAQLPPTTATFGGPATIEVPLRLVHGLIVLPVTINGHGPLQLILDTGAPVILIPDTALATRLGLQIVGQARVGGAGDGDQGTVPLAAGITARLGALEVRGAYGIVGIAAEAIPGVDGVIGAALFRHAVVEVDWEANVVRFHDINRRGFVAAGDSLRLRVAPNLHVYVPGTVISGRDTLSIELHLDTGARQPLSLAPATLGRFTGRPSLSIPAIVGFGSRGTARGEYLRLPALRLGNARLAGVTTAIPRNEPADQGRVGLPVLRRFRFFVDYAGGWLILQPRAGLSDPFPFTTTGIVLLPGRDSTERVVADVMAGSPALESQLEIGDTIVAVSGRNVRALCADDIERGVLYPAPGTTISLATRRNGWTRERRLTARVLLP